MILTILRNEFSNKTAIGKWFIENAFECFSLEDKDRGLKQSMDLEEIERIKIKGRTCIPYTDKMPYEIQITYSDKFKIHYPLVVPVPGYIGIRIHSGVSEFDTAGCLLTGKKKITDGLQHSQLAFYDLFYKLLVHKTNEITARELITLHKKESRNAGAFARLYNEKINSNKIFLKVEKSNNIIIVT